MIFTITQISIFFHFQVKWEKDGKEIKSDGNRITIEKTKGNTILTIKDCVRTDSGKYKLILTNGSGKIESAAEVIVLDKPSAPKGPLEVFDVRENGCKIKWKKPDDDGGVAIKQYKIEKLDTKSGKWTLVSKVSKDTTECIISDLVAGPEYKFRVSAINDEGESDFLVTENWTVTKSTEIVTKTPGSKGGEVGVDVYTTEKKGTYLFF